MAPHPVLFIPGPTEVSAELREIMAQPMVGHRGAKFVAVVQDVCRRLRDLYGTTQLAAFETCPATALMEAAIRNFVPRSGRTLHLVAGAFGERWREIAALCGRSAEALVVPLGQAHDPEALRRRLEHGQPVDAVAITHNETATGVVEPLRDLARVVRESAPNTLILADVVTSIAGIELAFDAFGLDFAFAGTQKCLALPPGLCTFTASARALVRAGQIDERGFLFDLPRTLRETSDGKTLATPCIPLVFALQRQLERVAAEGLSARWARHLAMRDTVLAWAERRGMQPFVQDAAARSPTVSCIDARGADVAAMAERASKAGFTIDRGYGELRDKAFRIGHMGDHSVAGVEALLAAL